MRTMRIKQRFFDLIQSNKKTHEVRVGYDSINQDQNRRTHLAGKSCQSNGGQGGRHSSLSFL